MDELIASVVSGNNRKALQDISRLLSCGMTPEQIILKGLTPAMESLDSKCSVDNFDLLEIMLAGRCVLQIMERLFQTEEAASISVSGKVVLGTIKGDVHNLGKNVVKAVFMGSGYQVIDVGTNVTARTFVDQAVSEDAGFILVSSLLTTTLPYIREISELLPSGSNIAVVAGGAAVAQTDASDLNVDYAAGNVFDGLNYCNTRVAL